MRLYQQAFLLFTLNFLDAVFTLFWVHNDLATEGNQLMASLLESGYMPFLIVKVGIGALASIVVWHWRNVPLAKYGLNFALAIYISIMGVHLFTGLAAFGFLSNASVDNLAVWTTKVFALFA